MSRQCTACSLPLLPPFLRDVRPSQGARHQRSVFALDFQSHFLPVMMAVKKAPQSQDMGWS